MLFEQLLLKFEQIFSIIQSNEPNNSVDILLKKYGTTKNILEEFCFIEQKNDCPIDMHTGKPLNTCLNIRSLNQKGIYCRQIAKENPEITNTKKIKWCSENRDHQDCKCLNRYLNPMYELNKNENITNGECWYNECENGIGYMRLDEQCPSKVSVCKIALNIQNAKNVSVDHVNNVINCQYDDEHNKKLLDIKPYEPISNLILRPKEKIKRSSDYTTYMLCVVLAILFLWYLYK